MSKEKQCECCHEWWYDSDVKEDLCPNCYYYFKQLKHQLEEKNIELKKWSTQYAVAYVHRQNALIAEKEELKQQLKEKDKEIEKINDDNRWYSMWHDKYQEQIKNLTTELETYRPTKLHGNGQCKCFKCQGINWTNWCSKYKGHIYCNECLKEILKEEKDKDETQLAIQELEKVKDTLKHFCNIHSDEYYGVKAEVKGIELDVCESIDYQIKELKGEK